MTSARILALAAALSLAAAPAAAEVPAAEARTEPAAAEVTVHVTRERGDYQVEGRCVTTAPTQVVWDVLTDYDGIERFVPSMRESRVTERSAHHCLVEQTAVGRVLWFSRRVRVVLFVEEEAPRAIRFDDVLRKDFTRYCGEWGIEDLGARREIRYRVTARPAFRAPDVIARGMFARTVRELLSEVAGEIARRAEAMPSAPAPESTAPEERPIAAPSGDGQSPQTHGKEIE